MNTLGKVGERNEDDFQTYLKQEAQEMIGCWKRSGFKWIFLQIIWNPSIGIPLCWFCFPMITTTWFVALQTQHNRSTDSAYGVMHAVFECMFPRVGSVWFRGSTSITLLLFPWSDPQKWLFWCWCNYAPAKKKPSGYGSKFGFQWITLSIRHSLFELSNINRNTIYWCILSTKHMHGI